jgi:hypothetical protein
VLAVRVKDVFDGNRGEEEDPAGPHATRQQGPVPLPSSSVAADVRVPHVVPIIQEENGKGRVHVIITRRQNHARPKISRVKSRSNKISRVKSRSNKISPKTKSRSHKISRPKISQDENLARTKSRSYRITRYQKSRRTIIARESCKNLAI